MLASTVYLYEHCEHKRRLYEDAKTLELTLDRFNFLAFFADLKASDHRKGVKICERFLKLVKFSEPTTASYLLHFCKNHNIEQLQVRIKLLSKVYESYFREGRQ